MKKILTTLLVLILSIGFMSNESIAKLNDFKEGIEKEEKENRRKERKKRRYRSSSSDDEDEDEDDDDDSSCAEGFALVAGAIIVANLPVHYTKYPYADKKNTNYFVYNKIVDVYANYDGDESTTPKKEDEKFYYFSFMAGGYWARDSGYGLITHFRGKFWKMIGPEFDTRNIWEGKEHLGFYGLGINISIFQIDFFIFDFYIQAALMNGILNRQGVAYGGILMFYPVKPLSLTFKIGGVSFEQADLFNFEFRMGFFVNRVEFFAGYRLFHSKYSKMDGPLIGIQVFI